MVMVLMSSMMSVGLQGVLLGKQRETAVQEMNRLLEISRSLAYDNVGLAQNDPALASDPAIVDVGGQKQYLVEAPDTYEPLSWATNTSNHPFNPHVKTFDRGPSELTSYVYVTGVDANGNGSVDYRRVTVRVEWTSRRPGGPENEVRAQTLVSEGGIVPIAPPGSGGSAVPLSGETFALAGTGSLRVDRGSLLELVPADAPTVDSVIATYPQSQGSSKAPVPNGASCTSTSVSLQGPTHSYGNHTVSVTADDDPTSGAPPDPDPKSHPGTTNVTGSDAVDNMLAESTLSSPVTCEATVDHTDALPYERGTATGPTSMTFTQDISGTGLGVDVLSVMKQESPNVTQQIDHDLLSGSRLVQSGAHGSVGETRIMEVVGAIPRGLVRVGAFQYDLHAGASALDPGAPTFTVPGGIHIEIWDPNEAISSGSCSDRTADGYCQVTVNPDAAGFQGWSAGIESQVKLFNLGLTEVKTDVTVDVLPPAMKPGIQGPNGETIWEASYTAVSITARTRITVTVDELLGTKLLLTDSIADVVLGQGRATGCMGAVCVS